MKDIIVKKREQSISFLNQGEETFPFVELFINGQYAGAYSILGELSIPIPKNEWIKKVNMVGYRVSDNGTFEFQKEFSFGEQLGDREVPVKDYRAGDILVACDNVNGLPYGYMGHSALVVDEENIIESVISDPIIRKAPISQFTNFHPNHAHFRPKNQELGKKASQYAENYLMTYLKNKESGIGEPIFYFSLQTPLTDEWKYIYCSKLVWLSYHYGANYTFINDHLWFAPEDLYTQLSNSPDFDLIYKHPNYQFLIDM